MKRFEPYNCPGPPHLLLEMGSYRRQPRQLNLTVGGGPISLVSGMCRVAYRVVYDVLDDNWVWVPGALAAVALLAAVAICLQRWRWRSAAVGGTGKALGRPIPGVLIVLFGVVGLCFALVEYSSLVEQSQSKEWVRTGQYDTVEGPVSDHSQSGKGATHRFRVQGVIFVCDKAGGFRSEFTAPDAPLPAVVLRDGAQVRITHREGRVLQIEIPD